MSRYPWLQISSCCRKAQRPLLLINRILPELILLKQSWGATGKSSSLVRIWSSSALHLRRVREGVTESPKLHQALYMLHRQGLSRFSICSLSCFMLKTGEVGLSLKSLPENIPFQEPIPKANLLDRQSLSKLGLGKQFSTRTLSCLPLHSWKRPSLQFLPGKNIETWSQGSHAKSRSYKWYPKDSQNATTNLNATTLFSVTCDNTNDQRGWIDKNTPPSWIISLSKVLARNSGQFPFGAQSRCLHHNAAAAMRTNPGKVKLREYLSAENEARCRRSLEPNRTLYKDSQGTWAAVLVSLCQVGGEPAFLFTLRSSLLKGRHKGDVSFAGGKRDPVDKDVVGTALREAHEELGISVAAGCVWGILKPLRDRSGMIIAPVIANLGPLEALSFHPNPAEVEEIFTITISHLCSQENRGYTHFRAGEHYSYTLPVFRNGKHRVWGLTAVALDHTLKVIIPP